MTNTSSMHAVRMHDYGGPDQLIYEQAPRPQPQAGQVLVKLAAAGVNPADWKFSSGAFKQFRPLTFPWIPGIEGAGLVEDLGADVSQFQKGQAVYGFITASYAEYALVQANDLQPRPQGLDFDQAASVPVGALTAWGALIETAQVQPGQRVLVQAAAGGVGSYAVQLAHWKGAHVIGTASAVNAKFVLSLGADEVVDYTAAPFETLVHDIDVVIDAVGGDIPERSLKTMRPGGILVSVAAQIDPKMGEAQGKRMQRAGRAPAERLLQISQLLESRTIQPVVGKSFPLSETRRAWELGLTGHGRGRILLKIAS